MLTDALTRLYGCSLRARRMWTLAGVAVTIVLAVASACLVCSILSEAYSNLQDRRFYLGNLQIISQAIVDSANTASPATSIQERTFLRGKNKEVVSAELQNWLGQAAAEAGVELQSIESTAITAEKKQDYIGLSATTYGSWKAIQNLIFKIETAQPMLFVRDVDIQSSSYGEVQNVEPQVTMRISFFGALASSDAKDGSQ